MFSKLRSSSKTLPSPKLLTTWYQVITVLFLREMIMAKMSKKKRKTNLLKFSKSRMQSCQMILTQHILLYQEKTRLVLWKEESRKPIKRWLPLNLRNKRNRKRKWPRSRGLQLSRKKNSVLLMDWRDLRIVTPFKLPAQGKLQVVMIPAKDIIFTRRRRQILPSGLNCSMRCMLMLSSQTHSGTPSVWYGRTRKNRSIIKSFSKIEWLQILSVFFWLRIQNSIKLPKTCSLSTFMIS